MDSKTFGLKIKMYRKRRKLTQEKLAELTGYTKSHVSKIENGNGWPALDCFIALCHVLKISPQEILGCYPEQGRTSELRKEKGRLIDKIRQMSDEEFKSLCHILKAVEDYRRMQNFDEYSGKHRRDK